MDRHNVPGRSWQWAEAGGQSGVHTMEGRLVWWHTPGGPGGHFAEAATPQEFDDFIQRGPAVDAPSAVLRELLALLQVGEPPAWLERYPAPDQAPAFAGTAQEALAIAMARLIERSWDEAARYAELVLRSQPDDTQALFVLGVVYGATGELDKAEVLLRQVVGQQPEHYDAWYNLGVHHMARAELDEAIECLRTALQIRPDNHPALYQLGFALEANGQDEAAMQAYADALRTSPNPRGDANFSGMDFTQHAREALTRLADGLDDEDEDEDEDARI